MKTFKTLAEFKRVLSLGDKLHAFHHGNSIMPAKDLGVREVVVKQSNAFALKTDKGDGSFGQSWLEYPKASLAKIDEGKLIVLHQSTGEPLLTYKFV